MPAQTHGRVYNGFNIYPRKTRYAQPRCPPAPGQVKQTECYQKALCCGTPIQPTGRRPSKCRNTLCRVPTGIESRKFASTTVIGRSTAAKRAIGRRVANCRPLQPTNTKSNPHDPTAMKCCCMVPTQMGTSCCPQRTVTTFRTGPPPSIGIVVRLRQAGFSGQGDFPLYIVFPADGFANFQGGTVTLEALDNQGQWFTVNVVAPVILTLTEENDGPEAGCTDVINAVTVWTDKPSWTVPQQPTSPPVFVSCENYRAVIEDVAGNIHRRLIDNFV